MTLYTRNRTLLAFSTVAAICSVYFIVLTVSTLTRATVNTDFFFALPSMNSFFTFFVFPNYPAAFFSLAVFLFFVPAAGFTLYFNFEKTQSTEALYFYAVLIGFFTESFRVCIPIFGLQAGYCNFVRFIGKAVFFGQIQIMLAVITQGILAVRGDDRNSDKYFGVILVISVIFSIWMPLNTTAFKPYMIVTFGYASLFAVIRIVFMLCTFLALFFSSKSKESFAYRQASIDFLLLCAGYLLLLPCKTFAAFIAGTLLMSISAVYFFKNLRSYYMWK